VGSMVNGDVGTGVTILVAYVIAAGLIVVFIGILLAPAVWIWGLVDAYQGAQRWNRRHGIIS
jgi:TM2 domain-containing membrane protein YozV